MTPDLALLRPALELAVAVARRGERATPAEPAPRQLRPFLRFTRLPPAALAAARAAVDDDEAFRARVGEGVDEDDVGRAGFLFLTRPDGWEGELAAIVEERAADLSDVAERAAVTELTRVRDELDALRRRLDEQTVAHAAELSAARRAANDAAAGAERLRADVERLEFERDRALDERARAVRELKDTEARLARRTEELRRARESADSAPGAADPSAEAAAQPSVDLAALTAVLDRLRSGASALQDAIDDLGGVLAAPNAARSDVARSEGGRPVAAPRRRPTRLRSGLAEGTPEAVAWLLSQDDALLLVDGYNVTIGTWPALSLAEQRAALERAADAVQQRFGPQVVLVFDGDEAVGHDAARTAVGSSVRVRFTPEGIEADDEILAMVDRSTAPVLVVVSDDRRVRDGAARRGANVLGAVDFVAAAR